MDMGQTNLRLHTWGRPNQCTGIGHWRSRCSWWRFEPWRPYLLTSYTHIFLLYLQLSWIHRWERPLKPLPCDKSNKAHTSKVNRTTRRCRSRGILLIFPLVYVGSSRLRTLVDWFRGWTNDLERILRKGTLATEGILRWSRVKESYQAHA